MSKEKCVHLKYQEGRTIHEDDNVRVSFENDGEKYGIYVSREIGGDTLIVFNYCPWCGEKIES